MDSKLILTNDNRHTSRLIKSFQEYKRLSDFKEKPDGVWGSYAEIKCGGVKIKSDELDFEFDVPFDDNLEADEGTIIIYNLSDNTVEHLKTGEGISIEAGYSGDTGVVFKGHITKSVTDDNEIDRVTTLKIVSTVNKNEHYNHTYEGNPTAQQILKDLLKEAGIDIGEIELERDFTYEDSVTVDEPLDSAIKEYSEICGVSTFIRKGALYSCKLSKMGAKKTHFRISEETGLIGNPAPFEETDSASVTIKGYEVKVLLQHRLDVGEPVKLESKKCNGIFYVKSGSHSFNESECITTVKLVEG